MARGITFSDVPNTAYVKLNEKALLECNTVFSENRKQLVISNKDLYNWFKAGNAIPLWRLRKSFSDKWLSESTIAIKDKSNKSLFVPNSFPLDISFELGEFIGHVIGDGSLYPNGVINYTNSEPALISRFKEISTHLFGITSFYECSCTGAREVILPSIIGKTFRNRFGSFTSASNDYIPLEIMNDNDACRGFLRAIFDDEGSVTIPHKVPLQVRIFLKQYDLVSQIREALINIGIEPGRICKNGGCYGFGIYGCKKGIIFMERVNFKHPKKNQRLMEYLRGM